jgi:hypothetical protein
MIGNKQRMINEKDNELYDELEMMTNVLIGQYH